MYLIARNVKVNCLSEQEIFPHFGFCLLICFMMQFNLYRKFRANRCYGDWTMPTSRLLNTNKHQLSGYHGNVHKYVRLLSPTPIPSSPAPSLPEFFSHHQKSPCVFVWASSVAWRRRLNSAVTNQKPERIAPSTTCDREHTVLDKTFASFFDFPYKWSILEAELFMCRVFTVPCWINTRTLK